MSLPLSPPAGLMAIIELLHRVYPDQKNPQQVTTLLKYWLGGHDPLDYISMYSNSGDPEKNIPPHWHYVSFGLSDLHGDGRVHVINKDNFEMSKKSGMGFELTFRLQKTPQELRHQDENPNAQKKPPTWPASLLQSIARYCFQSGNGLCSGDNIPWRRSLDGGASDSKLQNILIASDPQLETLNGPFGTVDFCQIVGVTEEEIEQASVWNGRGVLNYLREELETGGEWLVTNMTRRLSFFELFPERLVLLKDDLEKQGSDLAGINANFIFREISSTDTTVTRMTATQQECTKDDICIKQELDPDSLNTLCLNEERTTCNESKMMDESSSRSKSYVFPGYMSMSCSSLLQSSLSDYQPTLADCVSLNGIAITLAPSAAKYIVLAIKHRLRHGRHFTFKAPNLVLTLISESVTGALVTKAEPYGVIGYWIQVLISDDLIPRMIDDFRRAQLDEVCDDLKERLEFNWPDKCLKLIIDQPKIEPIASS